MNARKRKTKFNPLVLLVIGALGLFSGGNNAVDPAPYSTYTTQTDIATIADLLPAVYDAADRAHETLNSRKDSYTYTEYEVTAVPTEKPTPLPGEMVWVSEHGKRYHSIEHCSGMKNPRQVPEAQAKEAGREPCKDCYHLK